MERAEKIDNTEESRLYSLLKRIAVGIIAGSFFFAIVRYLAQQYSSHLARYELAHTDEVLLRKFYLAYDIIGNDLVKQTSLLNTFLGGATHTDISVERDQSAKHDLGEGDKKIIAEILEIIKKRM